MVDQLGNFTGNNVAGKRRNLYSTVWSARSIAEEALYFRRKTLPLVPAGSATSNPLLRNQLTASSKLLLLVFFAILFRFGRWGRLSCGHAARLPIDSIKY